jgi:ubiquinone/menaquinone biosynthesis C-methylase UbiE
MIDKNNKYTEMQRNFYNSTADIMAIDNHRGHDSSPDYYGLLLSDINKNFNNKKALDFGCGVGRNIDNLLNLTNWGRVDGCDISSENILRAESFMNTTKHAEDKYKFYVTTGVDLQPIPSNEYDFVMSTIVLQHIAVYSLRYSILSDIYRVMNNNSLFSFQMSCFGKANYYDEELDISGTNGAYDVCISNPEELIDDLEKIGFTGIRYTISNEWDAYNKKYCEDPYKWIYIKANKCL